MEELMQMIEKLNAKLEVIGRCLILHADVNRNQIATQPNLEKEWVEANKEYETIKREVAAKLATKETVR